MSVTFRITTTADDQPGPIATINARQLAAFRAYLREQGERLGIALLNPDSDEERVLASNFEARVCPLALASVARVFDHDEAVISVLDEAQFRGRRIAVWWYENCRTICMRPSLTSDLGAELDLAEDDAHALLQGLGLKPDNVGEIPIGAVRDRLANPAVRRRAEAEGTASYFDRLDQLLVSASADDSSRLEWA
jgi:hypothetical protein